MWAHEFSFKLWKENPAPAIEAIRGYLETDYDFAADLARVARDLEAAKAEVMLGVPAGEGRDKLALALTLSLKMNPLTPDHHFYIDQGTNARVRVVLIAIGKKLVTRGMLLDPEDVMYLRYNELRAVMAGSFAGNLSELVSDRRDQREDAYKLRPRDWVGTATEEALAFPYLTNWGFPEKFHRKPTSNEATIDGLPASSGVVEGWARVLLTPDDFDKVQKGEIAVCRTTSPAWVVLFTRIGGLVTDAGGMASHPAVVSREFGIPAVVGTSNATLRIRTGDRIRVNGSTGQVDVLSTSSLKVRSEKDERELHLIRTTWMAGSSFVLFLDDPRCRNVNLSGGKGASIATMMQEGLPVPPGFVVTSAAFAAAIDRERLRTHCLARDIIGARKIIATAKPPMPVVADHYATLGGLVAVRSSACAEDFERGELRRPAGNLSRCRWPSRRP